MPYYPEDQSDENLKKLRRDNVCSECGRQLYIYFDIKTKQKYIACPTPGHEGISREYQPQREDYQTDIRRSVEMEQKIGHEGTRALANIPMHGQLTQPQAMHILKLVYPEAPEDEIIRCAIFCHDFGLHPLAKEVYIIPFGDKFAMVVGIPANRKIAHAVKGEFSFLEDTPRVASPAEVVKQFGEDSEEEEANIISITKLKGEGGNLALGFGLYPKNEKPKGLDKGNSRRNMANIRSERQAMDRLPGRPMPRVEVVDERYADLPDTTITTEDNIIEGEGRVIDKSTGEILGSEPTPKPKVHHCDEHDRDFEKRNKFGKDYWSHPLPGGKWCNEKDQKAKPKPDSQASIEPSEGPTLEAPESTPVVSETNGIPKTTEELYTWVAKMMQWPDSTPARSFLVNKIKIEEAKIDSDPEGCYNEAKALMGW